MATKYHNLSDYNPEDLPKKEELADKKIAIIVADWNNDITYALRDGAYEALIENGIQEKNVEIFHVPGAFELTYASSKLLKTHKFDAIITIGCVIQGDTPHFTYVCEGVTQGITELNLKGDIPVIFSILTTNTKQQALDRAGGYLGNKGVEGAITAIKMIKRFGGIK
ncbi:MAG: 6,7-dimethyl-8-ribityllumazine synthase [Candidatus Aphodosoma sp.]